ncbi:MAG: cytochrome d ubiquinol oxidase subunit II [Polyangiaceae bacterium]
MSTELLLGGIMVAALVLYVLFGGADFGGGVWDLLASGPRKREQRALIEKAIGPIWEANHVWLILVVVLLFAGFPRAFAILATALHVPMTLFLLGVVARGSAFTFRAYDSRGDRQQKRWGMMFSLASLVSPVLLGMIVGTIASGRIRVEGTTITSGFFMPWLSPFPLAVGAYALTLFAFLAAVYLCGEAGTDALKEDFRRRALGSGVAVGLLALACFALSRRHAPVIALGLTDHPLTWPLHVITGLAATTAFYALFTRRFTLARGAAIVQATMIVLGWAASQYPYLVVPDVNLFAAAGNARTRTLVLIALGVGSLLLFPSLYFLYRVFKGTSAFEALDKPRD